MAKLITVKFSTIGGTTGPFDIYTDVDLVTPLYTNVTKTQLLNGYSISIPDNATYVKIVSTGPCGTELILPLMTPTPTITPTQTATSTPTPSSTNTPTNTPTPSFTQTPTVTPGQTQVPTRTPRPTTSPTPTVTGPTPTPTNTLTPTPTPSETPKVSNTPNPTVGLTNTPTPTANPNQTPKPTTNATVTPTPSPTTTQSPTPSPTPGSTNRFTPTPSPSSTAPTPTVTPTPTPSGTGPTPSPTSSATPTPTPSGTGPTPSPTSSATPTPTPSGTGPTPTPSLTPTATIRITNTSTPTPTTTGPTPTPSGTGPTPTPTNQPIPTCVPLYNTFTGDIYFYDVVSKTSVLLNYIPKLESHDIAHSSTKLYLVNDFVIYDYNLLHGSFVANFVRSINYPSGYLPSKGLFLKNNTTLVVGDQSLDPTKIYEMDLTTNPPTMNYKFSLPSGRIVSGDFLITTGGKFLVTTQDLVNGAFITQYDYSDGSLEYDINITSDCPYPWGVFQYDDKIYISTGNLGDIYQMELNPPYTRTYYDRTNVGWFGASQTTDCLPLEFSGITPTPTFTPTPTPTPTLTPTITPSTTPSPSPTQEPVNCDPIYNTTSGNVYKYEVQTRTSTLLNVPQVINSFDIAHTSNKLWVYDIFNFVDYNITISPWTASINRIQPWPAGFVPSKGLCALDDFHLVGANKIANPNVIVEISLSPVSIINKITLPVDREIYGDIIVSSDRKCYVLTKELSGGLNSYLSIYNYSTSTLISEINITSTIPNPSAIFIYNNEIYVVNNNSVTADVYIVDLISPFNITYYDTTSREWQGASQLPDCIIQPTPTPTPSSTLNLTPTPTPNSTTRTTPTPTPSPEPTCAITLCVEDCGCDVLPCVIYSSNIKGESPLDNNSFYDVRNNIYNRIGVPNDITNFVHVAHTQTKVWKTNGLDTIYEWIINAGTTDLTYNREITIRSGAFAIDNHSALFAIDDNTLLTSSGPTSNHSIYRLDITSGDVDVTKSTELFLLYNEGEIGVESLILTKNNKLIVIERRGLKYIKTKGIPYVCQYDYLTGAIEVEVSLEYLYTGDTEANYYVFQDNGDIYISSGKFVYELNKFYPYDTTLLYDTSNIGIHNSTLNCNISGLTLFDNCPICILSGNGLTYFWDPATNVFQNIFLPNDYDQAINIAVSKNKIFKYYGGPTKNDFHYVKEWDLDFDNLSATFVKKYDGFRNFKYYRGINSFALHDDSTIILSQHSTSNFEQRTYDCPLPPTDTIIVEPQSDPYAGFLPGTYYPPYPSVKHYFENYDYFIAYGGVMNSLVTEIDDRIIILGIEANTSDCLLLQYDYYNEVLEFKTKLPLRFTGLTEFWGYVYLFGSAFSGGTQYVYKLEVSDPTNLIKVDTPDDWNIIGASSIKECQNYNFENQDIRCQAELPIPCRSFLQSPPYRNLPFVNEAIDYGGTSGPFSFSHYGISGWGYGDIAISTSSVTACTCNMFLPQIETNAIKLGTSGPYEYYCKILRNALPSIHFAIYDIHPNEEINFSATNLIFGDVPIVVEKVRNFNCFTTTNSNKIIGNPTMDCIGGGIFKIKCVDPYKPITELKIFGSGGYGGIKIALVDDDLRDLLPVICGETDTIENGVKVYNGVVLTSEVTGATINSYFEPEIQCGNLYMRPTKFGFGGNGGYFNYKLKFSEYVNDIILQFAVFNRGDDTFFFSETGAITVENLYSCYITTENNAVLTDGVPPTGWDVGGIFRLHGTLPYTSLTFTSLAVGNGYVVNIDCNSIRPFNPNIPTPTPGPTPEPTATPGPTSILTNGFTIYKNFGKTGDPPAPTLGPNGYTIYKNFGSK